MARLKCIRLPGRDASGYDWEYREVGTNKFIIDVETVGKCGSLLVDPMDADEWRSWIDLQVPGGPRVPSPRKWGDGTHQGRTLEEQRAYVQAERTRMSYRKFSSHLTREEAEALASLIQRQYRHLQVEVKEYKPSYAATCFHVHAWPEGKGKGMDYARFEFSDAWCRYAQECSLEEFVQRTLGPMTA